jgi:maltooligosyltrehalose synthase
MTVPADVVAFARSLDDRSLISIVPRLTVPLCSGDHVFPVGPDCWKTSRILLPPALAARPYRNVLTGECIDPTRTATQAWIFAGEAFRVLPVALLVGEPPLSE